MDRLSAAEFLNGLETDQTAKQRLKRNQIWLDVVWSLGIMNELTEKLGMSVLSIENFDTLRSLIGRLTIHQ